MDKTLANYNIQKMHSTVLSGSWKPRLSLGDGTIPLLFFYFLKDSSTIKIHTFSLTGY